MKFVRAWLKSFTVVVGGIALLVAFVWGAEQLVYLIGPEIFFLIFVVALVLLLITIVALLIYYDE